MDKKFLKNIIIGPALFLLVLFLIPDVVFDFPSRVGIGTVAWMSYWWITQVVGSAIPAFLPIAVNAIFNVANMGSLVGYYMNATVLMVLSAFILSITWNATGLDRRIALKFLNLFGTSVPGQFAAWFIISAVMSSFLPNIPTAALLLPVAAAMLKVCGYTDISKTIVGMMILSTIAWGAYLGAIGTPLGAPMNLITVNYFEQLTGHEHLYLNWLVHCYPMLFIIMGLLLVVMILIRPRKESLAGSREFYKAQYAQLGKMSRDEWLALFLFMVPSVLGFMRPLYADILPGAENAYVFLLFAILSFCIVKKDGSPMNTWANIQANVPWDVVFMIGGGLALGDFINNVGVTARISEVLVNMGLNGGFLTVFVFTTVCIIITEFCGNIASAVIMVPLVIGVCTAAGLNPIPYIYITIAAYNSSFMTPTSLRVMPMSYGVTPAFMMKYGGVLTASAIIIVPVVGYAMMTIFPNWMAIA